MGEKAKERERESCNDDYLICFPAQTHQEVVWFDVSMQKPFGMNKFYSCDLEI